MKSKHSRMFSPRPRVIAAPPVAIFVHILGHTSQYHTYSFLIHVSPHPCPTHPPPTLPHRCATDRRVPDTTQTNLGGPRGSPLYLHFIIGCQTDDGGDLGSLLWSSYL